MKIKLIDRYNFTKFIDSQEVFSTSQAAHEFLLSTPVGDVRFELTGETRGGVPYYRQARRQEEHQPAYSVPDLGEMEVEQSPRLDMASAASSIYERFMMDAGVDSLMGGAIGGPTTLPRSALEQRNMQDDHVIAPDCVFQLSSRVLENLRGNPHLTTVLEIFLRDVSNPMQIRRAISEGVISNSTWMGLLRHYATGHHIAM